jgi:glycosyltransferase involved in cell wall biosynthesis
LADAKISLISVIVPVYNEEESIGRLHRELNSALPSLGFPYELIYVDDGSTDSTFARLEELFESDSHVRVLKHRRNFGQTEALVSGFKNAQGDVIVTIDADLQHDPRDMRMLLELISEGADAVIGWRINRQESFLRRTIPSRVANFLGRRLLGIELHDLGCGLKAYKAECVRNVIVEGDGHLFLPAAVAVRGYKVAEVKINDRPRGAGSSKFGASTMRRQFLDLIFFWFLLRYWRRPLHFFGTVGLALLLFGIAAGVVQVLRFFLYNPTTLMTPLLLLAAFLVLAGIQFVTTGILFEIEMRPHARTFEIQPAITLSHERASEVPRESSSPTH